MPIPLPDDRAATDLGVAPFRGPVWLAAVAAWSALILLFALATHQQFRQLGTPVPFGRILEQGILVALPWVASVPGFLWIGGRWAPVAGRRFWRAAGLITAAVASGPVLSTAGFVLLSLWRRGNFGGVTTSLGGYDLQALVTDTLLAALTMSLGAAWAAVRLHWRERAHRGALAESAARLEAEVASAELASLRARLRPHFVGNALNAIGSLIRLGETERALDVLAELGAIVRQSLAEDRRELVPLVEEVAFVRRHLEIASVRFGPRVQWEILVPDALLPTLVPPLTLAPLVENAIEHGVGNTDTAVTIAVSAEATGPGLRLRVYDSGPALPTDWDLAHQTGVGLRTTAARFRRLYGPGAWLSVRNVNGGVEAAVTVPGGPPPLQQGR